MLDPRWKFEYIKAKWAPETVTEARVYLESLVCASSYKSTQHGTDLYSKFDEYHLQAQDQAESVETTPNLPHNGMLL